ncbi:MULTISPECIES: DUF29 domain-containing protein [unclassified Endozoicomonas]|uniref:DUF29 domain-containing protein n=1 Tax=unclassified Endozoicomonas TaxID=2644528 RepID=UPI002148A0E7|nr:MULTISPECIES: DUF29 domain-containing protein [unclassified Endozoicomonas]
MSNLYETDYHQWLTNQVALLRNHNFDQLDLENLLEELELSIKQDLRELESFLVNLILHLLKMDYQTTVLRDSVATKRVIKGWAESVFNARDGIVELVEKNHSLAPRIEDVLEDSYFKAKKKAIKAMNLYVNANQRLDESSFPDTCPWSYDQMMTEDWYPLNGVNLYE